jgi:hypothetical protein
MHHGAALRAAAFFPGCGQRGAYKLLAVRAREFYGHAAAYVTPVASSQGAHVRQENRSRLYLSKKEIIVNAANPGR